uniref:PHD-type domain-containing protein n=1 Tax=Panagrolaimus sp. ES5 TaxID=591445 RepID=A0AC34EZ95_9BILA
MVVGIESWKDVRTSLMKDVHGFAPQSLSCRPQAVRRTNSLNSIQSLCSTNFSSDEDNNFSSGFLDGVPLPPDEDAEEDWRMFGWLLDSADASSSMPYPSPSSSDEDVDDCKPKLYSPLPPLEIPSESLLPEASDLLKIKRKRCFPNKPLGTFTDQINNYRDLQSRKRSCSVSTDGENDSEDEEDIFECRAMTRSMAHYLELKRRRKIGAPMPEEEIIVRQEPKIEIEETYVYEEQPVNKEYSMESEAIETSEISQQQYIDTSSSALVDIKAEILDSTDSSPTKKGGVEVIRGIKASDGKRTKAGRPTKKEKRQIERENKKILKKQQQELSDDLQQFCGTKTCYCQKIFDPTLDYIKCSYCSLLFHPKCAKLSLSKAEKLSQWFCKGCDPNQTDFESVKTEASTEEVLCICNEPYDANSHWVGCNMCDKWFHPECVNTTIEAVQAAGEYICSACTFQRALHGDTEEGQPIQQNEDGVFYA